LAKVKHIHMIGIAGSAMAPLAGMLRERGYRVTGSDAGVYPPSSTLLESLGIGFSAKFDAANLTPAPTWWWWATRSLAATWKSRDARPQAEISLPAGNP